MLFVIFLVFWSPWGDYEDCSVTCGEGVKVRRRTCVDPDMTGDTCSPGQDFEEAACTGPTCGMFFQCYLNGTKQWHVNALNNQKFTRKTMK